MKRRVTNQAEIAEARAEIERLKAEIRDNNYLAARQIVPAEMAVDDFRAEIERKDKLINQMREALKVARITPGSAISEQLVKAALEAAERSESGFPLLVEAEERFTQNL